MPNLFHLNSEGSPLAGVPVKLQKGSTPENQRHCIDLPGVRLELDSSESRMPDLASRNDPFAKDDERFNPVDTDLFINDSYLRFQKYSLEKIEKCKVRAKTRGRKWDGRIGTFFVSSDTNKAYEKKEKPSSFGALFISKKKVKHYFASKGGRIRQPFLEYHNLLVLEFENGGSCYFKFQLPGGRFVRMRVVGYMETLRDGSERLACKVERVSYEKYGRAFKNYKEFSKRLQQKSQKERLSQIGQALNKAGVKGRRKFQGRANVQAKNKSLETKVPKTKKQLVS